MSGHPELHDAIKAMKKNNTHFSRILREYEGIDLEISRAESEIPWYLMSDLELDQLKKERLHLKDALLALLK